MSGCSPDRPLAAWRVSSHVRGDSTSPLAEQIEFQYGPDERSVRLRGDADLTFGRKPEIVATLSSPQIDLDRLLALPDPVKRRPLVAAKSLAESLLGSERMPVPVRLGIPGGPAP